MPSIPLHRAALALAFAVLTPAAVAHAQFGGLKGAIGKKIGDKVTEKITDKPKDSTTTTGTRAGGGRRGRAGAGGEVGTTAGIEGELTADTLDRVLGALEVQLARRAERDSLAHLEEATNAELARFTSTHAAATDAYKARETTTHECQQNFLNRLNEARGAEVQRRMKADPTFAQKAAAQMQAEMMRANQAMQRGDSSAATSMYSIMYKAVLGQGVDLAKDSADMVKRCGQMPLAPAHLAQQDSLNDRLRELGDRKRQAELEAQAAALEQSGMSVERFGRARERLERWWVTSARGGQRFWTDREDALFEARRERIGRIMVALGVKA